MLFFKLQHDHDDVNAHVNTLDMLAILQSMKAMQKVSIQKQYVKDSYSVAKPTFQNTLQVPYPFHLLLQLFFYASLSRTHCQTMKDYLCRMSNNNLLTYDRLLTIISYSGDLASRDQMLRVTPSSKNIKKTKQLLHGMLILGILEAAACYGPDVPIPDHACTTIKKCASLCYFLTQHDQHWASKLNEDSMAMEDEFDFQWSCTFDIFLSFYWRHIKAITSEKWFTHSRTYYLAQFLKPVAAKGNVTYKSFFMPLEVTIVYGRKELTLPYSMNGVLTDILAETPHCKKWELDNFRRIRKFFGTKEKIREKKRKKPQTYTIQLQTFSYKCLQDQIFTDLYAPQPKRPLHKMERDLLAYASIWVLHGMSQQIDEHELVKRAVAKINEADKNFFLTGAYSANTNNDTNQNVEDIVENDEMAEFENSRSMDSDDDSEESHFLI